MSDFFRIVRGLEINDEIRLICGTGAPGLSSDTNTAGVGSVYTDKTTGELYTKTSAGSGTNKWSAKADTIDTPSLYAQNALTFGAPSATGVNSIAIGDSTSAPKDYSIALGFQSITRAYGGMAHSSGMFGNNGDCQRGNYVVRNITTNNSFTELFADGENETQRIILPDDSTWMFKVYVVGHRTDASDGHAGYTAEGVIYRAAGAATTSLQGNIVKNIIAESNGPWDINIVADTTHGALVVQTKGQNGKTIRWAAHIETIEVTN